MPNIKSAKKRVLTAESRRLRNAIKKSVMKTQLKKFSEAVSSGDKEEAQARLKDALRVLDKTASKGVIHKNMAARKKSRLQQIYNGM
jgi:small subunit ribosomal protein S20